MGRVAEGRDGARGGEAAGQRGQAGDAAGHGGPADLPAVGAGARARRGVDDEVDLPGGDAIDDVGRALADLLEHLDGNPHPFDRLGGAARRHDREALVVQGLGDRVGRRLVRVRDGDEDRAAGRQGRAGGGLGLGERGREVPGHAHHLTGGAHLRAEARVEAVEAVERQHGLLDRNVADRRTLVGEVEIAERLPQHQPAGKLR